MWTCVILLVLVAHNHALPAQDNGRTDNDIDEIVDCLRKDSAGCVKHKFFSYVDKVIGLKEALPITDGISLVRTANIPIQTGAPRNIDAMSKLKNYADSHSLRIEVKGSDIVEAASNVGRALEDTYKAFTEDEVEGRDKKKKYAKILGPIMVAMAMKKMAMMPLAIGAIALIAGKALLVGKIALVLAVVIGLKKLLSQQKHVTYEVVAHPHHATSHTSSHDATGYGADTGGYGGGGHSSGWGRSTADADNLAYSAQKPQQI